MEYLAYPEIAVATEEENVLCILPKLDLNWKKTFKSAWLTFANVGVLLALVTQVQIASASYYGPGVYYVSTNGSCLNVRDYPSLDAPVNECVDNGSRLPYVTSYRHGFARLDTGDYVATDWLSTRSDCYCHHRHHHDYYSSYYRPYYRSSSYYNRPYYRSRYDYDSSYYGSSYRRHYYGYNHRHYHKHYNDYGYSSYY